jgi:signal transduction protein with GAF and PtsI domain
MKHDQLSEPGRLAALRKADLLDTPPEEAFDQLARVAARVTQAPMALVSIVDVNRQFLKSCIGSIAPRPEERETPITHSFCKYAVMNKEPLIIADAREHPLVKDNPAITEYGVIAYLGIPLITRDGYALGTLCVLDSKPRIWNDEQVEILQSLASSIMTTIAYRSAAGTAHPKSLSQSAQHIPSWAERLATVTDEHIRALDSYDQCIHETDGSLESLKKEAQCREATVKTEGQLRQALEEIRAAHGVNVLSHPENQTATRLWEACNTYLDSKARQSEAGEQFQSLQIGLGDLEARIAAMMEAEQALRTALYEFQLSRE